MVPQVRQLGDLTDDITQAAAEMTDLNNTLTAAVAAGQTDAIPGLKQQLAYWRARWQALSAQQHTSDTPSALAQWFAGIQTDPNTGAVTPAPNWLTDLEALFKKVAVFGAIGIGAYLVLPAVISATRRARA